LFYIWYTISMNAHEILINEILPKLPENIQYAIKNLPWTEKVLAINSKYHLAIDQLEKFKDVSMMVAAGLIPSDRYAKSLEQELAISRELSENLVFDANDEIFDSLQELAFGNKGYEIAHEELVDELDSEGVRLVHDDDTMMINLDADEADSSRSSVGIEDELRSEKNSEEKNTEIPTSQKVSYHETISDDDLRGVSGHRIPNFQDLTSNTKPEQSQHYNQNILENVLLTDTLISKGDTLDASPTEGEQVKQDGDFINKLKQETEIKPAL
jgi:hypothetical protein